MEILRRPTGGSKSLINHRIAAVVKSNASLHQGCANEFHDLVPISIILAKSIKSMEWSFPSILYSGQTVHGASLFLPIFYPKMETARHCHLDNVDHRGLKYCDIWSRYFCKFFEQSYIRRSRQILYRASKSIPVGDSPSINWNHGANRSPLSNPLFLSISVLLSSITGWAIVRNQKGRDEWVMLSLLFLALIIYPGSLSHYGVFLIVPVVYLLYQSNLSMKERIAIFCIIFMTYLLSGFNNAGYYTFLQIYSCGWSASHQRWGCSIE
jgi:hypothetical protein